MLASKCMDIPNTRSESLFYNPTIRKTWEMKTRTKLESKQNKTKQKTVVTNQPSNQIF